MPTYINITANGPIYIIRWAQTTARRQTALKKKPSNTDALLSAIAQQQSKSAEEILIGVVGGALTTYINAKDEEITRLKAQISLLQKQLMYFKEAFTERGLKIPKEFFSIAQPEEKPQRTPLFSDLIQADEPDEVLRRLHSRIDGKGGKLVAMVLLKARELKLICSLPTEKQFRQEFTNITSKWRSISYYLNPNVKVDVSGVAL